MSRLDDLSAGLDDMQRAEAKRAAEFQESLSGEARFIALNHAINDFERSAPKDHDVFIQIDDIIVREARFIKPHTFFFEGFDQRGHRAGIICHFSQVKARVLSQPRQVERRTVSRVIRGFAPDEV